MSLIVWRFDRPSSPRVSSYHNSAAPTCHEVLVVLVDERRRSVYPGVLNDEISAAELIAAVSTRYRIRDLTIAEPEIEAIVRRLYEEGL
jgi:ABC-type uncharacterized transport system ATPase subunit